MRNNLAVQIILLGMIAIFASCGHSNRTSRRITIDYDQSPLESSITIIGQPEQDTSDVADSFFIQESEHAFMLVLSSQVSEQLLKRKAYIVSYNKDKKIPNWVAWHLTAEHTDGDVPRDRNYYEDKEVPLPRATDEDYRGSGWTHGHMCPAGDNKWDEKAMMESNLLTNICPQDGNLNSGLWNTIEQDCRKWARKYGDVYIVCGPVFLNSEHETIGENKVVVPEAFFKVILCLRGKPKAIGYVVGNNGGNKKKDLCVCTVDEVERMTGYDFFPALPDSMEERVEAYASRGEWR